MVLVTFRPGQHPVESDQVFKMESLVKDEEKTECGRLKEAAEPDLNQKTEEQQHVGKHLRPPRPDEVQPQHYLYCIRE